MPSIQPTQRPSLTALAACLLLAALALLAPARPCPAQSREIPGVSRPIVIGGDRDYPPYEFLDKNGQPAGYNVDLSRAIAEVMGLTVEFRLGAWAEMRAALARGEVDILEGMSYSEERLQEVEFTPPHTTVVHSVFARKDLPPVSSLEDLRGRNIVMHRGGIMHDTLAGMGFTDELHFSDTPADALRMVASGHCDYAVTAMLPGLYIIRENKLDNLYVAANSVATVRYGYAVKKGNTALKERFSEGLAIIDKTGKYEQIRQKWLGVLEARPVQWEAVLYYVGAVVAPLVLLLGATVLWSHSLRRKVAERTRSLTNALDQLGRNQQQLVQADKMAALGILVSGVAHEINNPNGLILLNIPILRKVQADTARILDEHLARHGEFRLGGIPYERMRRELPAMLEEMFDGAQRIKRIVNDLKDFARSDEARAREPVDVNQAAGKAARLLDRAIRQATDRFSLDLGQGLPPVLGNAQRIEQVVVNLLLNACQALPDRTRAVTLATRYNRDSDCVELTVRDEGVGIAPEHMPHLTDPFFTTKRAQGGTGLGLSVSAGIVKDMGGVLEFQSSPGHGTAATLSLPAAQQASQPGPAPGVPEEQLP
ncbi:transporter substrate-binding domain-containing protein [Fundidesulfovibrio agrisoli]|uniref:transporter substrate-binding domain-containing protein n=1 Tax=Fundidesulfovibrio agrisoli TaxID=2922717 RepID=UPI001FAC4C38|nr:transporter substrate-binding domain-containing protein [Fundidesulfovibrio agrisoli]